MTGLNNGRKTNRCISNALLDRTKTKTRIKTKTRTRIKTKTRTRIKTKTRTRIKTKTRTRIKIKAKTEPARLFSTKLSKPGRNQGEKPCAQRQTPSSR